MITDKSNITTVVQVKERFQITVPRDVRSLLNLKVGDFVEIQIKKVVK